MFCSCCFRKRNITEYLENGKTYKGRCINVVDGDTVDFTYDNKYKCRIRLSKINAPEMSETTGVVSRDKLVELINKKKIWVVCRGKDRYGRFLGEIYLSNNVFTFENSVNDIMLEEGYADVY